MYYNIAGVCCKSEYVGVRLTALYDIIMQIILSLAIFLTTAGHTPFALWAQDVTEHSGWMLRSSTSYFKKCTTLCGL